jgi:hypothetical protein
MPIRIDQPDLHIQAILSALAETYDACYVLATDSAGRLLAGVGTLEGFPYLALIRQLVGGRQERQETFGWASSAPNPELWSQGVVSAWLLRPTPLHLIALFRIGTFDARAEIALANDALLDAASRFGSITR